MIFWTFCKNSTSPFPFSLYTIMVSTQATTQVGPFRSAATARDTAPCHQMRPGAKVAMAARKNILTTSVGTKKTRKLEQVCWEIHGKTWKNMENNGKSLKNHRKSHSPICKYQRRNNDKNYIQTHSFM